MTHAYHQALPGYHPDQILHDGCPECESRGENVLSALDHIDAQNFRRAWLRAADLEASTPPSGKRAEHVSKAEHDLLRFLWAVQVRFEKVMPFGYLPAGVR